MGLVVIAKEIEHNVRVVEEDRSQRRKYFNAIHV